MFENIIVDAVKSLLTEKILTPEKIAAAKIAIIQRVQSEKLVENTVDSVVDILVTTIFAFMPEDKK